MIKYDADKPDIIKVCNSEPIKDIKDASEIFVEGQIWKDRHIYCTILSTLMQL